MVNSTVLITGAAGFIGSHLAEHLLVGGHNVLGLDNFCDFYEPNAKRRNLEVAITNPKFTLIEADIRDRSALDAAFGRYRPDVVVHLAAMAGVRPSIENPKLYTDVNTTGTANILDAAVSHKLSRFVLASSSSVYGNNDKVPFSENDAADHPISPYAATKKACGLMTHAYHHLYKISVTCLRFFTVFGPRQRPDLAIATFLSRLANDQTIFVFGDGSTSRDYTYVDDIVSGIIAAIDRCDSGSGYRIYNLGNENPISLGDLIATIENVTGKRARIERRSVQPGDVRRTWADITLARSELEYRPSTSLEAGIAKQWDWVQKHSQG